MPSWSLRSAVACAFASSNGIPVASATFNDRMKRRNDSCGVNQGGRPQNVVDSRSRGFAPGAIFRQHGFHQLEQQFRVRYPADSRVAVHDGRGIVALAGMFTARTEQRRMAGGSVETFIDGGDTGRP